jgi:hypothetical protein
VRSVVFQYTAESVQCSGAELCVFSGLKFNLNYILLLKDELTAYMYTIYILQGKEIVK